MEEQTPHGQNLARFALRNAVQGARRNRGRAGTRRSRLRSGPGGAQPVPLKVLVAEVADHFDWPVPVETTLVNQWDALAGNLAVGLIAVRFDPGFGVLSLRGVSPAWAATGRFRSKQIVRAVNNALGQQVVRELAFLPPVPARPPVPLLPLLPRAFRHPKPPVQDDEQLVFAAWRRQAAQAPREPEDLFLPPVTTGHRLPRANCGRR
ncbi:MULTISPECIES: DciA family protein [unclassified Streptomyces]|uniref:DciA family protein n=1 Tax=unclassified Streptomyces TaxID=2593676 RepID=UPI0038178076